MQLVWAWDKGVRATAKDAQRLEAEPARLLGHPAGWASHRQADLPAPARFSTCPHAIPRGPESFGVGLGSLLLETLRLPLGKNHACSPQGGIFSHLYPLPEGSKNVPCEIQRISPFTQHTSEVET